MYFKTCSKVLVNQKELPIFVTFRIFFQVGTRYIIFDSLLLGSLNIYFLKTTQMSPFTAQERSWNSHFLLKKKTIFQIRQSKIIPKCQRRNVDMMQRVMPRKKKNGTKWKWTGTIESHKWFSIPYVFKIILKALSLENIHEEALGEREVSLVERF